jgi:hypothetical protein
VPQFLAIDWDEYELRYVQAEVAGHKATVRAVGVVPLEAAGDPENQDATAQIAWGEALAAELKERKLGKPHLLVGVPRRNIELLYLTLPPAKDDELPELVANQSISESPQLDETWTVDFVPGTSDPASPREVTAVAISPESLEHIQQQATVAGLKAERILLRPFAATSLLNRLAAGEKQSCLVVNRVGNEVDLCMLIDGRNVLSRTARLPESAGPSVDGVRLAAEIARTLAIAPRAVTDESVDADICLLGSQQEYAELVDQLAEAGLVVEVVDPFVALKVADELRLPDRARFAALLGMLLDQAAGTHSVDFLHPRKSRPRTNRWRLAGIAGGAVAALALAVAGHVWMTVSEIEDRNREMYAQYKQMDATMEKIEEQNEVLQTIAAWKRRDINWLDELRDLSYRFPGPRDAVVLRMNMRFSGDSGGLIDLQGLVRDPKVLAEMEHQVRDDQRRVRSRRLQERSVAQDYTWMFETSMAVSGRDKADYARHLPGAEQPEVDAQQAAAGAQQAAVNKPRPKPAAQPAAAAEASPVDRVADRSASPEAPTP